MEWLKEFRVQKNMTIHGMAEAVGVSKSLYEKVEYGDRNPSSTFIKKFKNRFPDVDTNVFFASKAHETCINKSA